MSLGCLEGQVVLEPMDSMEPLESGTDVVADAKLSCEVEADQDICVEYEPEVWDDGLGDFAYTDLDSTCATMASQYFSTSESAMLSPEGVQGNATHLTVGMMSAVLAQARRYAESTSFDDADACEKFVDPNIALIWGDDPMGLTDPTPCDVFDSSPVPFACGNDGPLATAMSEAINDFDPTSDSLWYTLQFDPVECLAGDTGCVPTPSYQASAIWMPILKALHTPNASPALLLFENQDGIGAVTILEVGFQVHGPMVERQQFLDALNSDDAILSAEALAGVTVAVPTSLRYRQGNDIRTWPGENPIMHDGLVATTTPVWRFTDSVGIIDPCYALEGDSEDCATPFMESSESLMQQAIDFQTVSFEPFTVTCNDEAAVCEM